MFSKEKLLSAEPEIVPQRSKSFPLAWIEERVDVEPLRQFIRHKMVPLHRHSYWYYLGGMALFLMTFMVNTFAEILRQRLREKYKTV